MEEEWEFLVDSRGYGHFMKGGLDMSSGFLVRSRRIAAIVLQALLEGGLINPRQMENLMEQIVRAPIPDSDEALTAGAVFQGIPQ